jgi:hypothetical protein
MKKGLYIVIPRKESRTENKGLEFKIVRAYFLKSANRVHFD